MDRSWWAEVLASKYNLILTSSASWETEDDWVRSLSQKTNVRCFVWAAEMPDLVLVVAANLASLRSEGIVPNCAVLASGTFPKDVFRQWDYTYLSKNWQINLTFPLLLAQGLGNYLAQDGCIQVLLDTSVYNFLIETTLLHC